MLQEKHILIRETPLVSHGSQLAMLTISKITLSSCIAFVTVKLQLKC